MNRSSLVLLSICFVAVSSAHGQSGSRAKRPTTAETPISESRTGTDHDLAAVARAIAALKRLESDVFVYRSLGDFEDDGRLARVPYETFTNDFREVTAEVEPLLYRLAESRLRSEIRNALASYRDGALWWQKTYQPRVVQVSALVDTESTRTSSDVAFSATIPYTVAIHWRQANRYLRRAEDMVNRLRK